MSLKTVIIGTGLYAVFLAGCANEEAIRADDGPDELAPGAILHSYMEEASANGVLRQMTIYSYHFVSGTARLNQLGSRDVNILARHFRDQPGTLNVLSDDVHVDLYAARMETVRATLIDAGVQPSLIFITDGLPGGDGMRSLEIQTILSDDESRSTPISGLVDNLGGGS